MTRDPYIKLRQDSCCFIFQKSRAASIQHPFYLHRTHRTPRDHHNMPDTTPPKTEMQLQKATPHDTPPEPQNPTLQITINPPLNSSTTSQLPHPSTTSPPNTVSTTTATKATSPPPSPPNPQTPPSAPTFGEIHWDRSKTSPASTISSHSPLSDTMDRIPYIAPTAVSSRIELQREGRHGDIESGHRDGRVDPQARIESWLEGVEEQRGGGLDGERERRR